MTEKNISRLKLVSAQYNLKSYKQFCVFFLLIRFALFFYEIIHFFICFLSFKFLEKILKNELISKKYKNVCKIINYTEYLNILASTNGECAFISPFASLICLPVGIAISGAKRKVFVIPAGIKKYNSVTKKRKRNMK